MNSIIFFIKSYTIKVLLSAYNMVLILSSYPYTIYQLWARSTLKGICGGNCKYPVISFLYVQCTTICNGAMIPSETAVFISLKTHGYI